VSHDWIELWFRVGLHQPVGELLVHVQVGSLPEQLDRGVEVVHADLLDVDQLRRVRSFRAEEPPNLLFAGRGGKVFAQQVLK